MSVSETLKRKEVMNIALSYSTKQYNKNLNKIFYQLKNDELVRTIKLIRLYNYLTTFMSKLQPLGLSMSHAAHVSTDACFWIFVVLLYVLICNSIWGQSLSANPLAFEPIIISGPHILLVLCSKHPNPVSHTLPTIF